MKKLLLVLFIAIIPAMAFAQFQIGGTALYSGDITAISSGPISAGDFLLWRRSATQDLDFPGRRDRVLRS